jgi:hypothetical protein
MSKQEQTGWAIIAVILLIFWWLGNNALGFLHGTSVQTTMKTPGGDVIQQTSPTTICDTCS